MIRSGAGEDFLQWDFEQGNLGFLESQWDLKGFSLFNEGIDFPAGDNFEAIDFSYASFYHSKLKRAIFYSANIAYATIYNCEFVNCIFAFTGFYGSTLEKVRFINCDFMEEDRITNCDLKEVTFKNCFIPKPLFFDCKFDEQTTVDDPRSEPSKGINVDKLNSKDLAEIFKGIKESYRAGQVNRQSRYYFFKERQCITRYNLTSRHSKIGGYLLEFCTAYGIKPSRVLITMIVLFAFFSAFFTTRFGFSDGLLLSAGAFFTFGANSDLLQTADFLLRILYVAEAFVGISSVALFITVLANVWLGEK